MERPISAWDFDEIKKEITLVLDDNSIMILDRNGEPKNPGTDPESESQLKSSSRFGQNKLNMAGSPFGLQDFQNTKEGYNDNQGTTKLGSEIRLEGIDGIVYGQTWNDT